MTDPETGDSGPPVAYEDAQAALHDVLEFYHDHVDDTIADHTEDGGHPERPTTAREYFTQVRGWSDDVVDELRLGWAPPDHADHLIAHLHDRGHSYEAMLATGLIGEYDSGGSYTVFPARYVFPYYDADGDPAYAIARCTGDKGGGKAGYDGHPRDYQAGKYAKVRHTDDAVPFAEPIWGLNTLQAGEPVVVAEGVADAIRARQAGHSVLSPVAKEFKRDHIEPLRDALAAHDVPTVCIVPDSETAPFAEPEDAPDDPDTIGDALDMPAVPAGLGGSLRTAALLEGALDDAEAAETPDVRVAHLPRAGLEKVDLDDYLGTWSDDLDAVLASARPAHEFGAYGKATRNMVPWGEASSGASHGRTTTSGGDDDQPADQPDGDRSDRGGSVDPADPHRSGLWALDVGDVTPAGLSSAGDRGKNHARHSGRSGQYFVLREGQEGDLVASDYKGDGQKAKYNALTYLLVDAGERDRDAPEGSLSDREVWLAWRRAREAGHLPLVELEGDTVTTSSKAANVSRDGEPLPDPIPLRALWHLAREHDLVEAGAVPDSYDDTRLTPADRETVLTYIRDEFGLDPHRTPEPAEGGSTAGADTPAELSPEAVLDADTTLDRQEAWHAARAVSPADLDEAVGLDGADGGWRCPACGDHVDDAVRAAGLAAGALDCCGDPFTDPVEYDRLYTSLREDHGAPLPEYIPPTQAVEDADRARGATEALRGWQLLDGLDSTITNENPAGGDAVVEIDPNWEPTGDGPDQQGSGRVVLFSSGLFYCREHEQVLWPLQVVGLEHGLLDDEDGWLQGNDWLRAYARARTEYDAPLPPIVWNDAEEAPDPLYLPVLPDAEDLLGEGVTTDGSALDQARQAVCDLYVDQVINDTTATNHLLTVLPALGKSYNAVLQALQHPTLYTAKRLELRKEAADRAHQHDIECMHLPTLGETRPPEKVLAAVAAHVREHGRQALRDREALLEVAEDVYQQIDEYWPAYEDAYGDGDGDGCEHDEHDHSVDPNTLAAGDPCPGCGGTFDTTTSTRRHVTRCDAVGEDDTVDLDRAACGCGDGAHGPEWQLAFWTARKLGDKPRDLHVRGETIFGDTPPCCEGDCPYTVAWDRAADPDAPVDLLIGHPVHAYVSGARSRPVNDGGDVYVEDRVVALDEFPGDVYTREFGDEYLQHARWLAGCLDPDVEDTTDLLDHRQELWRDDQVAAWLDGEGSSRALEAIESKRRQADNDDAADPDWSALLGEDLDLDVDGDLAALVRRAVRAAADPDRDAETLLDTATTALRGGREGADALASGAEDGYAHPDAYWLLLGVLAPDGTDAEGDHEGDAEGDHETDWRGTVTAETRDAEHFDLGSDNGRMKAVTMNDRQRFLLDRDHSGAVLLLPPDLKSNTVAGLDATGRPGLWEIALGAEFTTTDIHETAAERRAFLRDVMNLRVVQTTPHVKTYSGDPTSKNFGDDIALVEAVADQYGQRQLAQDRLTTTSAPAVVTTKKVEDYVGGDLVDAGAARVDHYGDLIGSNRLDEHSVGAILGAEHYGHDAAEKWALLAGEEFEATGHGTDLDYTSDAANALLRRMRDDQVMQSIMRFGRDEEGAVVFAHTAALREDLPVVDHGDVAEAWTQNQQAVASAAADRQGQPFNVADVVEDDRVDCHQRTVRRVLNQFADLGHLQADRGHATEYSVEADPGTGQVELDATPELAGGGAGGGAGGAGGATAGDSGQSAYENTNTWFVWSCDGDRGETPTDAGEGVRLGPPGGATRSAPPG